MITNHGKVQKFEKEYLKRTKLNIKQNFEIAESLYREAVALGAIPMKDPLDGIEVDIKIARMVNSVSKSA